MSEYTYGKLFVLKTVLLNSLIIIIILVTFIREKKIQYEKTQKKTNDLIIAYASRYKARLNYLIYDI
jgi:hypothetical protein